MRLCDDIILHEPIDFMEIALEVEWMLQTLEKSKCLQNDTGPDPEAGEGKDACKCLNILYIEMFRQIVIAASDSLHPLHDKSKQAMLSSVGCRRSRCSISEICCGAGTNNIILIEKTERLDFVM
ncbi:hypothetical protein PoB_005371300 [Plakobranchus ocellatus]|uniref:Uncharacterized protein n=1 Tax=Plakobranchus ocellatus TaxID=259542 RepID=A0AAV4C888_9GAST|nr:hypothetical protein PoB_005371300 [Plakobranchus ocellatus]